MQRLPGRALTDHFAETESPLPEFVVTAVALRIPPELTAERVARRVDAQFDGGLLDEIRGLLAAGVPETAHPFSGLVYRQALIAQENRQYARRQLIWFTKEPNLLWFHGAGERDRTYHDVLRALVAREIHRNGPDT